MTDTYEFCRDWDANKLVETYHYSHYLPSNIQFCVTQIRDSIVIAACFFSVPATRWSEPVLELCRLVRKEETQPKPILTKLISVALKHIKMDGKFDLIVSFADSTQGHHGGIYQACSWNFHALRKPRIDGYMIDGRFVSARTCNHRYGTSGIKLVKILEEKEITCIPHYDTGKYLYWKSLSKTGEYKAHRLKLNKLQYIKPNCV